MPPSPSALVLRPVQTAVPPDTIWSRVPEDAFRDHLVTLEKQTNAVPMDVLTAGEDDGINNYDSSSQFLSLKTEKQVADDLAYLAAVTEGAQSVAAVCLTQHIGPSLAPGSPTLVIHVAGMDVIDENVKGMLDSVVAQLHLAEPDRTQVIFGSIIQQHQQKLLGRLRSRKWIKPRHLARTHKKPLWQDFENLLHRAQHIYPRKPERRIREATESSIRQVRKVYEDFETSADQTAQALQQLVKATFTWCKSPLIGDYASKLDSAGLTRQIAAALKTLRQLEKIGSYWRIAEDLVAVADQHPHIFQRIELRYLTPYASIPTSIAYESWAYTCHVHAEIQLVVELAKSTSKQAESEAEVGNVSTVEMRPRTIGTSKYLCYLCYLFLRYHGAFQMLSTHGRLYDQWTVPDLVEYDTATRDKFSSVLKCLDEHVVEQIEETKCVIWRAEPMTSRQNLLLLGAEQPDGGTLEDGVDSVALS
ncbi:hypothetical protein ASPCAL13761 [Aspergillus calidoustus]|uniref:Uncharacterized protein n=1 Tax=Aspergillus calidoustus TaxID=454130 RepID=A0A0U4ZM30_ASPCI|nr:hypothetical protein ASPCAL13761 [Aspergillus calidoustus]